MATIQIPMAGDRPKLLDEMTTEEVTQALEESDVAIVTPCAIEQHGPHLPLGTDWYIGIETTRRTLARLAERGHRAVGYAFPLGLSHNFLDFPGTITLTSGTFALVVKEICACLAEQGFNRFVLLCGNGGNANAMRVATDDLCRELDVQALFVDALPYQNTYRDQVLKNPKIEGHAAEGETSKILAVRPELVHVERAGYEDMAPVQAYRARYGASARAGHSSWVDFAPKGYAGDPTLAEAKTGNEMFERNSAWIADLIEKEYFQEDR